MREKSIGRTRNENNKPTIEVVHAIPEQSVVPYDENLLERARTQWQFGDWRSLAEIDRDTLQHHPERAKLALLAAAGLLQIGDGDAARQLVRRAQDWGCNRRLIARILSAGVHNSLGRAAALCDQHARAIRHFEAAIATSAIGGDSRLLSQARAREQLQQIQMFSQPQHQVGTTNGIAPADSAAPEDTYFMTIQLRLRDSVMIPLGFNTRNEQWLKIRGDVVDYQTENGAPLYLVSNQDGNFEKPPQAAQIPVSADTAYALNCDIEHVGDKAPILWIFQYAKGKSIDSQSIPVKKGQVRHRFRSKAETEFLALGIRLAGEGQLNLQDSRFSLEEGSEREWAQGMEAQIEKIDRAQKQEITNAKKQVEASIRLQDYLGSGVALPDVNDGPTNPDSGVLLVDLLEKNDYDGVVEFGCGNSTIIAAKALETIARRKSSPAASLLSIDHLPESGEKVAKLLQQAGSAGHAQVVVTPLVDWRDEDADEYSHYDCDETLQAFERQLPEAATSLLVIVNGPPAEPGKQARYPALPKILEAFSGTLAIHFLLNDSLRAHEQGTIARWLDELAAKNLPHTRMDYKHLEKEACLIEALAAANGGRR